MRNFLMKAGRILGEILLCAFAYLSFMSVGLPGVVSFLLCAGVAVLFWHRPTLPVFYALMIFSVGGALLGPYYAGLDCLPAMITAAVLAVISFFGRRRQGLYFSLIILGIVLIGGASARIG